MNSMPGLLRKRKAALFAFISATFILSCIFWQPNSVATILNPSKNIEDERELQLVGTSQEPFFQAPQNVEHLDSVPEPQSLVQQNGEPEQEQQTEISVSVTSNAEVAAPHPRIGKITISFGEVDAVYERAIRSHELHNEIMGYPQFVLREKLVPGLWSKEAWIFSIIVQEMSKPEGQRLEWLMWLDRDTVLMNPLLPLEIFIPPIGFDHIHLLTTNDRHGLNNGVFFVKVCEWSLMLFSMALTFPQYNPDIKLKYTEQSAMEEVLQSDWFKVSTARVPQQWFNAFPPSSGARLRPYHGRPGNLLLHFASNRDGLRPERMTKWMDVADQEVSEWRAPLTQTDYPRQIREYWRRMRQKEPVDQIVLDIEQNKIDRN